MNVVSIIVAIAFAVLAILHIYWASGGRLNIRKMVPVAGGEPLFIPGPVGTFVVAVILICFTMVALGLGFYNMVSVACQPYLEIAGYTIGGVLVLRSIGEFRYVGFFKRVRGSEFAKIDSWVYSPFCLLTGSAFLFLASYRPL